MTTDKILLLLADGMRPDFVNARVNPYAGEFLQESVYTLEGRTVMPSVTLPCHMSLFHSVPPERHGVLTNTWTPQVRPVRGLCEVLSGAGESCGFFYDWEELRDLVRPGPGGLAQSHYQRGDVYSHERTMAETTQRVVEALGMDELDFLFVYFGLPDAVGHKHGFGSAEYGVAVAGVWDSIKRIEEALPEGYGMIVTADHGGHGRGHGADCPEDMTIPIIFHGGPFAKIDAEKLRAASIMDIAPTIAAALETQADPDWEGESLFAQIT